MTGDDNVVGGAAPEDRNVIAANGKIAGTSADGVSITGDGNTVKGELDRDGSPQHHPARSATPRPASGSTATGTRSAAGPPARAT